MAYFIYRYKEGCERFYDFNKEDGSQGADDFTQIIWKGTKRFGIGFANVENGDKVCSYIVARYKPTGNVVGAFRDNVQTTVDKKTCIDPRAVYEEAKVRKKEDEEIREPAGNSHHQPFFLLLVNGWEGTFCV